MKGRLQVIISILIFLLVSIIYAFPLFKNINNWGGMDWDQFTFWNAVPRETILKYHQFPLWNPYSSGGSAIFARPHSSFLSPFYIFVLIFGPIIGLKLQIIIHLLLGMFGVFLFCKYIGIKEYSAYLPPFIYMLSSFYSVHIAEGHVERFTMAFLPWFFLFYFKSLRNFKYIIGSIISLALMILGGSVYVFNITVILFLIYGFFCMLQQRKLAPLRVIVIIFLATFLLCSIKLIPMLEFLQDNPRKTNPEGITNISLLPTIFLSRDQALYYQNTRWYWQQKVVNGIRIQEGWHEYGAYVGVVPLVLATIGLAFCFKKYWPLLIMGILSLWISLGEGIFYNLWRLLHKFPIYNSLHVPSRFILGFLFSLSIFSGFGLEKIERVISKRGKYLIGIIIALVFLDLFLVDYPLLKNTFTVKPAEIKKQSEFRQRYRDFNLFPEKSKSSMYPALLSNSGIINAYEVINVDKGNVMTISDYSYRGEVYLAQDKGSAKIVYFSPNKIVINVNVNDIDTLILNLNHYKGWRAKSNVEKKEVKPFNGLIATSVNSKDKKITFYYLPSSFIIGSLLSAVTTMLVFYFRRRQFIKYI